MSLTTDHEVTARVQEVRMGRQAKGPCACERCGRACDHEGPIAKHILVLLVVVFGGDKGVCLWLAEILAVELTVEVLTE